MSHQSSLIWAAVRAWVGLAAVSVLLACGETKPVLPEYCNVGQPPMTYAADYGAPQRTEHVPEVAPYQQVNYVWNCIEGYTVEERWGRNHKNCWVKQEEYRHQNPICSAPRS